MINLAPIYIIKARDSTPGIPIGTMHSMFGSLGQIKAQCAREGWTMCNGQEFEEIEEEFPELVEILKQNYERMPNANLWRSKPTEKEWDEETNA